MFSFEHFLEKPSLAFFFIYAEYYKNIKKEKERKKHLDYFHNRELL